MVKYIGFYAYHRSFSLWPPGIKGLINCSPRADRMQGTHSNFSPSLIQLGKVDDRRESNSTHTICWLHRREMHLLRPLLDPSEGPRILTEPNDKYGVIGRQSIQKQHERPINMGRVMLLAPAPYKPFAL